MVQLDDSTNQIYIIPTFNFLKCMNVSVTNSSFLQLIRCLTIACCCVAVFASCNRKSDSDHKAADQSDTTVIGKQIQEISLRIRDNPGNISLFHERAKLHLTRGDVANALMDMEKVMSKDTNNAEYFLTLADVHLAASKPARSKASLEKCLQLDPENKAAHEKLAELYFIARQYKESVGQLDEVLRLEITNPKAYFMKGMCYRDMGDTTRAISSFQTAIEQKSSYYDAYLQLAMIFHARNNKLARQYYDGALRVNPKSVDAYYGRALWYQENERDFDQAIQDYTSAVQLNPSAARAHFGLGYIHYEYLKVYDQAIKHYADALKADSQWPEAWFNRGLCYESLGDVSAAAADYRKALEINPDYQNAITALKRISGGRK